MRARNVGFVAAALALAWVGFVAPAHVALDVDFGRYHALVIGINDYKNLPRLETAVNDATAVADVLRQRYGFEVTLLLNPGRSEVIRALDKLRGELTERDNLLIYYAGHGVLDAEADSCFWQPVDTEDGIQADWISIATITRTIKAMSAKHVMVVSDSCYTGRLTGGLSVSVNTGSERVAELRRLAGKRSRAALVSGGLEPVLDGSGDGHSVFTRAFLTALRESTEVLDGQQLFTAVRRQMIVNADQTPEYSDIHLVDHDGGDFLFVPLGVTAPGIDAAEDQAGTRGIGESSGADEGAVVQSRKELAFWEAIKDSGNADMFRAYLDAFPSGVFAAIASIKIAQIEEASSAEPQDLLAPAAQAQEVTVAVPAAPGQQTTAVTRYPTMEAPDEVPVGVTFSVQVWLTEEEITPDVTVAVGEAAEVTAEGQIVMRLPESADRWIIRVVLSAPGFEVLDGLGTTEIELPKLGDSTPALFVLRAKSQDLARRTTGLRATLWYDGAYLASIKREIAVVDPARGDVAARASGPSDDVPRERQRGKAIVDPAPGNEAGLANGPSEEAAGERQRGQATSVGDQAAQIPDLTVYIDYDDPSALGPGTVILASPHFQPPSRLILGEIDTPPGVVDWLDDHYQQFLDATDIAYAESEGEADLAHQEMKNGLVPLMHAFGREVYRRFAPSKFKEVLWGLVEREDVDLRTIQVYSSNPVLPWEVMRPIDDDGARTLDFLSLDYRIARWHVGNEDGQLDRPPQSVEFRELAVIAPRYEGGELLAFQRTELESLRRVRGYREIPGRFDDFRTLVSGVGDGIVHFSGHGIAGDSFNGLPVFGIRFEDGFLDVMTWRGLAEAGAGAHPFYFFNACDIGRAEAALNFVEGWAPAVLDAGASGYIGGLWPLFDESAAAFAARLYDIIERELDHGPVYVADALREARGQFYETGDPTFLGYAYYGDVNLRFVREATQPAKAAVELAEDAVSGASSVWATRTDAQRAITARWQRAIDERSAR